MSEFGDKSAATVRDSSTKSALEASTKLSELFIEAASKKEDQKSFSAEMDEKLKDILPSLSIVSFKSDRFMRYDTDGDGAVSDKEIDAAIKSDMTSQKDKLMLSHLAKQYEVLKTQNLQDGKNGGNADGITDKDVDTYLSNNPTDRPVVASDGSTTQNFGTWQEKKLADGTIVKTADGNVFQYVPQGAYSKFSNIEEQAKGKVTINGKEVALAEGDVATMDENGDVTITHANCTSEVHHANGIVEKKNENGETVEIEGNGVHVVRDAGGKWYVTGDPNATPPTENMYLADGKKPEIGADGSISLDFGTWQQCNLPDGTIVKTKDGKVFQYVPNGDWNRCCTWDGKEWVDKDGNPIDIANVEVDEKHNVKVTHKDNSCEIHHPDGSCEMYDECGNKKCDVDAETAKATEAKKADLQKLSKIESGKGPYDAAKKMLEAAGVSPLTHKMILKFARWLRDEVAHKQSFKTGDQLVGDNDWQRVANKINEMKSAQKK